MQLFWWGIDTMNATNSRPGYHEATAQPGQEDHISRNGVSGAANDCLIILSSAAQCLKPWVVRLYLSFLMRPCALQSVSRCAC